MALELFFDSTGEHQAEIHVRRLLELSFADKAFGSVFWASCPTDAVVLVEVDASLSFFFGDDLQAVIIDKHVR